jgi:hypothetical protein
LFFDFAHVMKRENWVPFTSIFQTLADCGYGKLAIYANTGEFLCSASVESHEWLCDLSAYLSRRRGLPYVDICAAPQTDNRAFLEFCAAERSLMATRPFPERL